jgi:hypothetical protein
MMSNNHLPADVAINFLEQLRPGGPWQLAAADPSNKAPFIVITAAVADQLRAFVREHEGRRNLYYCPNSVRTLMSKKATKLDIAAVEFLIFDLDPEDNETPEMAKRRYLAAIAAYDPPPTGIIDSGNGIQGLHRLTPRIELPAPVTTTNADGKEVTAYALETQTLIADIEARSATLMKQLGGKPGTENIDRLLRLPGTTNLPTVAKRQKGRMACPTKLLSFNGAAYPLEAFAKHRIEADFTTRRDTRKSAHDSNPLGRINTAALANLDAWVPALFGDAAKRQTNGAYRVSSATLGRDLEEDLSLHPDGIKDFGVADMGDQRRGKRTPVGVVMEFGKKDFTKPSRG